MSSFIRYFKTDSKSGLLNEYVLFYFILLSPNGYQINRGDIKNKKSKLKESNEREEGIFTMDNDSLSESIDSNLSKNSNSDSKNSIRVSNASDEEDDLVTAVSDNGTNFKLISN